MESDVKNNRPLVVIVGPTASGKTALAVKIAQEFNGEVISADSRAIYTGLSVGTAKPTVEERGNVPHWGIDIVTPSERYTAADFKEYANAKIQDIRSRGRLPIIAGGTGLYVDAVIYDFDFSGSPADLKKRNALEAWSLQKLHDYCVENNISLPFNKLNKRHVINKILREGIVPQRRSTPIENTIVVGITTEKDILWSRIEARAAAIFDDGVIDEAEAVAAVYGWDSEAMTGNIYPLIRQYLAGDLTRAGLEERFIVKDRQLAKRQMTWFKRNEHIYWADRAEAYTYITRRLEALNNS